MTISKLASDVAENHWETKGMKNALQAERDYNLMTTQKLERLKVQKRLLTGVVRASIQPSLLNAGLVQVLKTWKVLEFYCGIFRD